MYACMSIVYVYTYMYECVWLHVYVGISVYKKIEIKEAHTDSLQMSSQNMHMISQNNCNLQQTTYPQKSPNYSVFILI